MTEAKDAVKAGLLGEKPGDLESTGEMGLDAALFDMPELGADDLGLSVEDLALDDVGIGALTGRRRRRRRISPKVRRKLSRLARMRPRLKSGRFAGLGALKRRRRRGGAGVSKAALRRRGKRIARMMKRSKRTGRFVGLKGIDILGLSDYAPDQTMMDLFALSREEGLGRTHMAARRRRRGGRARARARARLARAPKKRRKASKRGKGHLSDIGEIALATDGLAQVEVASSAPVLGVLQWLGTTPGLEALGGVALAPLVGAIVTKALSAVGVPMTVEYEHKDAQGQVTKKTKPAIFGKALSGLLSAIALWEFGRLVGSANIAKFGSFYTFGRMLEDLVMQPFVMSPMGLGGLGTVRVKDTESIGSLGKVVLPDTTELVGVGDIQRVPDTAPIGNVLLPDVKRPDYAVNPLSGEESSEIGEEDAVAAYEGVEESDIF
jgi:hypothetical protein